MAAFVRALSTAASGAGDKVVGKVCRLVTGGALVQLRDAPATRVQVAHPAAPARRLMIHDDVELTRGAAADGEWSAAVLDEPSARASGGRVKTGLPHLDERGGVGTKPQLLSDLHPWRKKSKGGR
ncbi:hypothetical protein KFE25_005209 [Diacronema lutheri]|uniref:Uncharacterized protein n=1 Tax=Diacronema lutheri TaxID=2081491 RepID=A0A8J6C1F9_DIALT|nr:hypothetical protein KFE25_005209 [Diacronema lutheri]